MSISEEIKNLQDDRAAIRTALGEMGVTEVSGHNFADFASDIKKISTGVNTEMFNLTSSGSISLTYYTPASASPQGPSNFPYIQFNKPFDIGKIIVRRNDAVSLSSCDFCYEAIEYNGGKVYVMTYENGTMRYIHVNKGVNTIDLTSDSIIIPVTMSGIKYNVYLVERDD